MSREECIEAMAQYAQRYLAEEEDKHWDEFCEGLLQIVENYFQRSLN